MRNMSRGIHNDKKPGSAVVLASMIFVMASQIFSLGLCGNADAQLVTQRAKLEEMSRIFREELEARRPQLYYDLLQSDELPQRILNEDPDIQLIYIDERGHPVFYSVDNLNAAKTISTYDVWPGGSGGFSLSGSGTELGELGIWDVGGVLTAHQEFGGRVTQMDNPSATHPHSTHVAGTMVASGQVDSARGMSYEGTLAAYESLDKERSEMTDAAASGMLVSNHSYGTATGWRWVNGYWYWHGDETISPTEDYGFGFYGSGAKGWDGITYYAPYYTIVRSAGNDRDDVGPGPGGGHFVLDNGGWVWSTVTRDPDGGDDGYDCISWSGTAKNIITVGAVHDIPGGYAGPASVVMASFSSWGPTDDGRIKPDIVANGVEVYSCSSGHIDSYLNWSGTSMSTPCVSGSLNLLIQHYEATHDSSTPLSSTVKALAIQTADEAGPHPGPDYMFGWGLMNTLEAAELIQADSLQPGLILARTLTTGDTNAYSLASSGTKPIRITIAWTDPPANPSPPALNDTTSKLWDDLDLRLEHVTTTVIYEPYVLDPDNPASAATKGDNRRDNVEQIHVTSPPAGEYRVTVTHKGTLILDDQTYSIVGSKELRPIQELCDTLYDGNGGPLTAGVVYIVTCDVVVPSGETLTIQSGAEIRFEDGFKIVSNGTTNADFELNEPIRLVSMSAPHHGMKLLTDLRLENGGCLRPGQ